MTAGHSAAPRCSQTGKGAVAPRLRSDLSLPSMGTVLSVSASSKGCGDKGGEQKRICGDLEAEIGEGMYSRHDDNRETCHLAAPGAAPPNDPLQERPGDNRDCQNRETAGDEAELGPQ